MRILVAEDDASTRMILQAVIEGLGHQCVLASDGLEAWQTFEVGAVDVVISDMDMPRMDGLRLCHRVRTHRGDGYTYFIFLTSFTERADLQNGMRAGADDYLAKPLRPEELSIRLAVAERITALHQRLAGQAQQLEELNRQFFEQGRTDALTHLGNRLRLNEDLKSLERQAYCAVLCDVDHFKLYNDSQGHLAGDAVLRAVAGELEKHCRRGDRAYRYGGEEFLLILQESSLASAVRVAERHRSAIQALGIPHPSNPPADVLTISAGVALRAKGESTELAEWLNQADAALYSAKRDGRNRVLAFKG
jgi:two-component system, cell cycle response regulator